MARITRGRLRDTVTIEINRISEASPGVYYVVLWCPESHILSKLLDPDMAFVLCWDHEAGDYSWRDFDLPILGASGSTKALSRIVKFDFIIPTERFLQILPQMRPTIKAVQVGRVPPDYLDMRQIHGKPLYKILADCGWHVLLDTPANDYGRILSPKREVLELAIEIVRMEHQTTEEKRGS